MSIIPGVIQRALSKSKTKSRPTIDDAPFRDANTIEEKIMQIVMEKRWEIYQEDLRRARVYYKTDLFFRGYQNIGPWDDELFAFPVYDEEPMDYSENWFRRNVLINAGSLLKMEPTCVIRPASNKPDDLEAAIANERALDLIYENIDIDTVKADKALFKVLFGNAFLYSDYQIDRRFGTILVPKFRYDDVTIPGQSYCPQCGNSDDNEDTPMCPQCLAPMMQMPKMQTQSQVHDGFTERSKGMEFTAVCSPLEVAVRSKVKGGMDNQPYLLWRTREDVDAVKYVFPQMDLKPYHPSQQYGQSGAADFENALRYQDILAALPGNIWGSVRPYWATTNYFDQVDVIRAWLHPMLYKGDAELTKQAPDGLMAVMVEGEIPEWRPECLTDHWTHEVYIRNAHSFYGDGMVDNVPIQRQINAINQLYIRHMEYDTIPLRLYEADMFDDTDFTNDPAKKWIPVNTSPDKGLDRATRDLAPGQLSTDVQMWKAQVQQADQNISEATDPISGKIAGANTPYSAQILAVEQGQTRFLPSMKYNTAAVKKHAKQLLTIAGENWIDPRTKTDIDPNTGKPSSVNLTGEDLKQGQISIRMLTNDFKPTTRGEQMQGLEYMKEFGVDVLGSPKLRLQFFEKVGFDPGGDMISTQTRRAYRQIDAIIDATTNGQPAITPDPMIDDGTIQGPALKEYLADRTGDDLKAAQPQAYEAIKQYMQAVIQMAAMEAQAMQGMQMPPMGKPGQPPQQQGQPGGSKPGEPPAKPGGQAGPPSPPGQATAPGQELAQSPAGTKQIMPSLPVGVR